MVNMNLRKKVGGTNVQKKPFNFDVSGTFGERVFFWSDNQKLGVQANERVTFVTEGVEHILSRYDSIKGTKKVIVIY